MSGRARSAGGRAAITVLEPCPEAASQARRTMRSFLHELRSAGSDLRGLDVGFAAGDAEVVVSELVTNAAEHGEPPICLRLAMAGTGLRIEVTDGSSEAPRVPPPDPQRVSGRGLQLVDALSRAWGTTSTDHGKIVWAIVGVAEP